MHYCIYSQYHKLKISYNVRKRFLGHSQPRGGGGGGGGEGGEEWVKIYCMLCPKFKNSTLDKIDNFAPRHGISNNLASL